jgi:hypothetical protein
MQTFPLNHLAEVLECDRGVMLRAMRHVKPDHVARGNRSQWRIATASVALQKHRAKQEGGNGAPGSTHALADKLEESFEAFDSAYAKLEGEPNLARRRKLDERLGVGKMIGDLDRQMKAANTALGEGKGLFAFTCEHLIGDLISRYLTLLDMWPPDSELAKLKAEGEARHAEQ